MTDKPSGLRDKLILASGVTLFAIGQSLLFIVIAPLVPATGITEVQFGLIFGIANIPLIFAAPLWGRLSDKHGRKPVFLVGLLGSAIGTTMMAFSLKYGLTKEASVGWVMALLFLSRIFYSSTASAIYPSSQAYMADVTERHQRSQGMALIGGANSLGSMLGPALGGGLAFMGLLYPMYAAAAIMFAGTVWAWLKLREPAKHADHDKVSSVKFSDKRLRPFMIVWAVFFLVFISLQFVTAFYIRDKFGYTDLKDITRIASIALACMAVIITVTQGGIMQVWKVHPRTALRLCGPFFVVALLIVAFAPNIYVMILGYSIIGISFSFATPGINGGASLAVEPHEQGAAAGILAAANTVGPILGPAVGPMIYQISPNAPMLVGAAIFTALSVYTFTIDVREH